MRKNIKYLMGLLTFVCAMGSSVVFVEPAIGKVGYGETFCYWGDVNGDEKVSLEDANDILKGALGIDDVDEKYDSFFENGSPILDDAQKTLKTGLGIVPKEVVTLGEYVKLNIEREYMGRELIGMGRNGISVGAHVLSKETKEDVLDKIGASFGYKSDIYNGLERYIDADSYMGVSDDGYTSMLIVADMENYFDLCVNIHGNGFDWIGTEEYSIMNGDGYIGDPGYFTAQEEIRCVSVDGNLEIQFAEDVSGNALLPGEINANLYLAVVEIPSWVTEEAAMGVYWQWPSEANRDTELTERYTDVNIEKEYIFKDSSTVEGEGISTGAYVVENPWYKNQLLLHLENSLGKENEKYQELKAYLDEKMPDDKELSYYDMVPVVVVTDMRRYFDLGAEMIGSGFNWHDTTDGTYGVSDVGPYGYYTAQNKINFVFSGDTMEIQFIEDEAVESPLKGEENENLYMAVMLMQRGDTVADVIKMRGQSNNANEDILLPAIDMKQVYQDVLCDMNILTGSTLECLAVDTDSLKGISEDEKANLLEVLQEYYNVEIYEASSVDELCELGIATGSAVDWSMDGYWLRIEKSELLNGYIEKDEDDVLHGDLYVYGSKNAGSEDGRGYYWTLDRDSSRWNIEGRNSTWIAEKEKPNMDGDMKSLYLKVLSSMGGSSNIIINTYSLKYATREEKDEILAILQEEHNGEVYEASSRQEIRDLGLMGPEYDSYPYWTISGRWLWIEEISVNEDIVTVHAGSSSGALAGRGYGWKMKYNGFEWEIISRLPSWVS